MLRYGDDEAVAKWAAVQLGRPSLGRLASPFVRPFVAIGVERNDQIVGAIIFTSFTGPDIEMTMVGHGCWTRGIFRVLAHYVFKQLGCLRISITLRNPDHEALAERHGFNREGFAPDKFGPGEDGILMGLRAANCRWM